MDPIQPDSRFDACEGFEITEVPDGRVVYQAARQKVHYLNPTAIVVLELLSAGKTAAEAALFLRDAYSLADIPTGSTNSCIQSLVDEGLLRLSIP